MAQLLLETIVGAHIYREEDTNSISDNATPNQQARYNRDHRVYAFEFNYSKSLYE